MKGIMFTAKGVTELIDEPEPQPGQDQLLLKTLYSAVSNGTERSFLTGGAYGGQRWPNRIGYLTVSEVAQVGKAVTSYAEGDLVYTGTFCGHVAYHCARERDLIIKVPASLDPKAATLLGLAGVSYFNAARAGINETDKVLVTGGGGIGLTALQAAKALGADATLVSATGHRRAQGLAAGADLALAPDDAALAESGPYSVLLECAGAQLDDLIDPQKTLLAPFARVALIAGRFRADYNFLWASRLRLSFCQSTHFDRPTLAEVTALAAAGRFDLAALIQDVVPLSRAVETYDTLRDRPLTLGGTVFDWTAV